MTWISSIGCQANGSVGSFAWLGYSMSHSKEIDVYGDKCGNYS